MPHLTERERRRIEKQGLRLEAPQPAALGNGGGDGVRVKVFLRRGWLRFCGEMVKKAEDGMNWFGLRFTVY